MSGHAQVRHAGGYPQRARQGGVSPPSRSRNGMSTRQRLRYLADYRAFYKKQQFMWQAMFLFKEYGDRFERTLWRREEEIAATRIQALARGAAKRRFVHELREHRMRELEDDIALFNDCAQSIQAAWRGYNVRRVLRPIIDARMMEFKSQRAATTIQRIVRGSTTRHLVAAMVQRRRTVERWMAAALMNMGIDPSVHLAVSAFTDALDVDEGQAAVQAQVLHRATVDLLANVTQMDLLMLFSPPDVAPVQLQALAGAVCEVFALPPSMTSARQFFEAENCLEVLVAMTPLRIEREHNFVIRSLLASHDLLELARTTSPAFKYLTRWVAAVVGVHDPVLLLHSRGAKSRKGPLRAVSSRHLLKDSLGADEDRKSVSGSPSSRRGGGGGSAFATSNGGNGHQRGALGSRGSGSPARGGRRSESKSWASEGKRGAPVRRASSRRIGSAHGEPKSHTGVGQSDSTGYGESSEVFVSGGGSAGPRHEARAGAGVGAGGGSAGAGAQGRGGRAGGGGGRQSPVPQLGLRDGPVANSGVSVQQRGGAGSAAAAVSFSVETADAPVTPRQEPREGYATQDRIRTPRAEQRAVSNYKLQPSQADELEAVMAARKLRVHITSFNLGGQPPPDDFRVFMPSADYHMYVFGFQNMPPIQDGGAGQSDLQRWMDALYDVVGRQHFYMMVTRSECGVVLAGFVHMSLVKGSGADGKPAVAHKSQAADLPTVEGEPRRGGLSLSFQLGTTKFLFVCCHLKDAETQETRQRNMDIDHIDRELGKQGARTPKMRHHVRATGQHDNVFLFGTLNYPINATMDDDTRQMLVRGDFARLLHKDLLRKSINLRAVPALTNLMEMRTEFEPTYRFVPGTDEYDTSGNTVPSWADRILFTPGLTPHFYRTNMDVRTSDHKPVSAGFSCAVSLRTEVSSSATGLGNVGSQLCNIQ